MNADYSTFSSHELKELTVCQSCVFCCEGARSVCLYYHNQDVFKFLNQRLLYSVSAVGPIAKLLLKIHVPLNLC